METFDPKAAVALIKTDSDDPEYLVIERAENPLDPWSGQLALPGGHKEDGDKNLLETGIRETFEETGIVLSPEYLIRKLNVQKAGHNNNKPLFVAPFLFTLPGRVETRIDTKEVSSVIWVKQSHLLDKNQREKLEIKLQGGTKPFPAINIDNKILWGFTYFVLRTYLIEEGLPF